MMNNILKLSKEFLMLIKKAQPDKQKVAINDLMNYIAEKEFADVKVKNLDEFKHAESLEKYLQYKTKFYSMVLNINLQSLHNELDHFPSPNPDFTVFEYFNK